MKLAMVLCAVVALCGCASQPYRDTKDGKFSGAVDVRWIKNDYFLFVPNKDDPLTFTRATGQTIRPGSMYTDGGSIPRFLWGVRGLSPWGYAPAYIVHDWLFEAQHCGYAPDNRYTFPQSADILAEGLKAIMEAEPPVRNYFVFDAVYEAVKSPIAKRLWEGGSCKPPIASLKGFEGEQGELLMTIRFK
jgi:hypothetical protein